MKRNPNGSIMTRLLSATALGTLGTLAPAWAQAPAEGFSLSLDGEVVVADPVVEQTVRQTDIVLEEADIEITYDPADPQTALDLEIAGPPRLYRPGDTVEFISQLNYPSFVERGEIRIVDRAAPGGAKLVATAPVDPNGRVAIVLPEGGDLVATHRVYDARGRYDETGPLPLFEADDRGLSDDVDELSDFSARRGIRVGGGTVTVQASNAVPGSTMTALGVTARADGNGRMIIQRILPPGDYEVDVAVAGPGPDAALSREVTIPGADWFYIGVADLTYGRYRDGRTGDIDVRSEGRLQYYIEGETASDIRITSSLDTGEFEIDEIFERIDDKDVDSILDRIDLGYGYPTYGDDSTIEDRTPTSGRFYLKVERDGNFALWGDYKARLDGSGYLRNERTLYGAQLHYESEATTARGDNRLTADIYAAQPDQLVGRDVFRGTGGSVYFLRRQDLTAGTETLTVELRDADTGRVVDRRRLTQGLDYDINYIQGVVTLFTPLSGDASPNLIETNAGGDLTVNLVAQYEYTPTTEDVDAFSTGGRVQAWVTDDLRIGVTALQDDTGVADQTAQGVDLRYEFGENSFVQFDYAESDGPGFANSFSLDGGLTLDERPASGGTGEALRFEGEIDLADLGLAARGVIGAYYEEREEGFTTLDYQVTDTTGDELLYGLYADITPSERLSYKLYADRYDNDAGEEKTEIGAEVDFALNQRTRLALGLEHLDEVSGTRDGERTTAGARLSYRFTEATLGYVFGQATLAADGLDEYDRYGLGLVHDFGNGWDVEAEVSDGDGGLGARLLANYRNEDNSSAYFGYELDPGRDIDDSLSGRDGEGGGRYVLGGRRQINDDLIYFAENTYDLFGDGAERLGSYGIEYTANEFLSFSGAIEVGELEDDVNGDVSRRAVSVGMRYENDFLTARARLEFRRDEAESDMRGDTDAFFATANVRYQINAESRLLFDLDYASADTSGASLPSGDYTDANLGYAYRPLLNERLNILARYRYLQDFVGQDIDGQTDSGPIQESHIFSLEGNYDLNPLWTVGGKIGGRLGESASNRDGDLVDNDAYLAVVNARYHVVRSWDVLLEARYLEAVDAGTSRSGALAAIYRDFGNNARVGMGYNFSTFTDDLGDLTYDDEGLFLNVIAKF